MHANTRTSHANRKRILAAATRNIAEHGFAHTTRPRLMDGTGFAASTLHAHFPCNTMLLAAICERHATALLEATGCVDPDDPAPPRAALLATAATRILACIDANPDAHTVLMRDRPCLPAPDRATELLPVSWTPGLGGGFSFRSERLCLVCCCLAGLPAGG